MTSTYKAGIINWTILLYRKQCSYRNFGSIIAISAELLVIELDFADNPFIKDHCCNLRLMPHELPSLRTTSPPLYSLIMCMYWACIPLAQ